MLSTVYLAAEDEPGLAVGRKLISEAPQLSIYREENGHGNGTLKSKASNYDQMARSGLPVVMLTDLDRYPCPPKLLEDWLKRKPSPGFLFRICVREVEAWLLADRESMAAFLGVKVRAIPQAPEELSDPKSVLIKVSQQSKRRHLRLAFQPTGTATIGPRYNEFLSEFIRVQWNIESAALAAPSLMRARHQIRSLATQVV